MSVVCLYDNTEHDSVEYLHNHLRKLKIRQEWYYHKHVPRVDLYSGELIPYKDYEQYHSTDFLNKNNLKKWLGKEREAGKQWSIEFLRKRKEEKGLIYAPTQVELRSLQCPSMPYYESIGGYYSICRALGYKLRFEKTMTREQLDAVPKLPKGAAVITDTREQQALDLGARKTVKKKVDAGDYALTPAYDKGVYVERKSISDLAGSLTRDLGRFKREMARAQEQGHYIVVLVENDINTALSFNYLPHMKRFTKVNPAHVFKNIRDLLHEYTNVQFLFVDGRKEAAAAVIKILELGDIAREIDLQFHAEQRTLIFA